MRNMMCYGEHRRKFWYFIPFVVAAAIFFFGIVVMSLWNAILPAVLGVKVITFWQALGILILSKILFAGFRGSHGHYRNHRWHEMREKWQSLTPEEREQKRKDWWGGSEPK
jgi:Ca2+/H+ antiporter, TMEM165/GDT1 family